MVANPEHTLRSSLAKSFREALIVALRSAPEISLRQLGSFASREFGGTAGEIRLGDLLSVLKKQQPPKKPRVPARSQTRTAANRSAYDERIFDALKRVASPAAAAHLIKTVGGSPLQVRNALARLIEAGRVSWSGRARGTRYFLA